jgi:hypothetical protein
LSSHIHITGDQTKRSKSVLDDEEASGEVSNSIERHQTHSKHKYNKIKHHSSKKSSLLKQSHRHSVDSESSPSLESQSIEETVLHHRKSQIFYSDEDDSSVYDTDLFESLNSAKHVFTNRSPKNITVDTTVKFIPKASLNLPIVKPETVTEVESRYAKLISTKQMPFHFHIPLTSEDPKPAHPSLDGMTIFCMLNLVFRTYIPFNIVPKQNY